MAAMKSEVGHVVAAVVPALNEAASIGSVVSGLIKMGIGQVIVADNGSEDDTRARALAAGATVVVESRRGYGAACQAGLAALSPQARIIVFADGDASDDPTDVCALVEPIARDELDLVVGSRTLGHVEPGALMPAQRVGNFIASTWLRKRFNVSATDLGPFRAIGREALDSLRMRDRGYGWTVEMQIKAARTGLRYGEVPVTYRRRIGKSKISGTVRGTIGAATKILGLLAFNDLQHAFETRRNTWRS